MVDDQRLPRRWNGIRRVCVAAASLLMMTLSSHAQISSSMFQHHFITTGIPGAEEKRWGYGTPALADFDGDGDLDYAFGVREDSLYWFEFVEWNQWVRHTLGPLPQPTLGAVTMDVDRDGWVDVVTGGFWYRNPSHPRAARFEIYQYDASIDSEIHDLVVADVDGDGRDDIVALGDGEGCFWYQIPDNPNQDGDWQRTTITLDVLKDRDAIHSGFFPRGAADLDSDGDVDIVLPDRWLENRSGGREWTAHPLPFGKRGPWGLSSRSWIVDLDGDEDADIVVTDSDQTDSRIAWLENDGSQPPRFTSHFLPREAPGTRGSFHSLVVDDFDGDGDVDILTVEQEDPSILPEDAPPRWYVFENLGGGGERFAERIIFDGRLGGHDVLAGDVDGDGDLDLCSKIWNRWPENANGGREHGDCLENLLK